MFEFIESLANSTYINFEDIKGSDNVDRILQMLRITPKDYMLLIANLTQDLTRRDDHELRVRSQNNLEYIRSDQTLTEYGICYTTNSFIARNLTTSIFLHRCQSGVKTEQYLRINERFRCKFATPGGKAVQAVQINEFDITDQPFPGG
ncbi:hypothetical protein RP20_CCG018375 [Aedes albopictus]|nr:hypothetical protein RP20_CCG018375 [Aedes albopictus]